mmetsp:Transcript_25886/g.51926  ORF Transcript_25886/g.51926 Transcript_25886/m.51926 type:complete len:111 (-) Transcript_25886:30-362(-)
MSLTVEVRTKPGETPITLITERSMTVGQLKEQLADMRQAEGWSASSMNLIRQGRFLEDDKRLSESSVCDGDFIVATNMVPRRPMPIEPADTDEAVQAQPEMPAAVEMTRD